MSHRAVVGSLLVMLPGCDMVLGAPDYQVVPGAAAPLTAPELLALHAGENEDCSACLAREGCGQAFEACADYEGCSVYSACLIARPNPASEARCRNQLDPDDETRDLAHGISSCFRRCTLDCEAGRDFTCAADYDWPPPPRATITLDQTLTFLDASSVGTPAAGASVRICSDGFDCPEPLQRGGQPAITDEGGRYTVDVDIATEPVSVAGFWGYRQIESELAFTHRLKRNVPIMVDQVETTGLLTRNATVVLSAFHGIDPAVNAALFQVFDCRGIGAAGIFVAAPDAPHARVLYKVGGTSSYAAREGTGTFATAEGSGVVMGLDVGRSHRIEARTQEGVLVASADVIVPGDTVVIVSLYPDSRPH